jgi:hypothetical protein
MSRLERKWQNVALMLLGYKICEYPCLGKKPAILPQWWDGGAYRVR